MIKYFYHFFPMLCCQHASLLILLFRFQVIHLNLNFQFTICQIVTVKFNPTIARFFYLLPISPLKCENMILRQHQSNRELVSNEQITTYSISVEHSSVSISFASLSYSIVYSIVILLQFQAWKYLNSFSQGQDHFSLV